MENFLNLTFYSPNSLFYTDTYVDYLDNFLIHVDDIHNFEPIAINFNLINIPIVYKNDLMVIFELVFPFFQFEDMFKYYFNNDERLYTLTRTYNEETGRNINLNRFKSIFSKLRSLFLNNVFHRYPYNNYVYLGEENNKLMFIVN